MGDNIHLTSIKTCTETGNKAKIQETTQGQVNEGFLQDLPDKKEIFTQYDGPSDMSPKSNEEDLYDETGLDQKDSNSSKSMISKIQDGVSTFYDNRRTPIKRMFISLLLAGYSAYFGYAMYYSFGDEGSIRLLVMTAVAMGLCLISIATFLFGSAVSTHILNPIHSFATKHWRVIKIVFCFLAAAAFLTFIIVEVALKDPKNLVSLSGVVVYILLFFIFSSNPSKVVWRPVLWGLGIQFCLALIILRTKVGFDTFSWIGDRVQEFIKHTDEGAKFVFGEKFENHRFAFKVLPVVVFFSTVISVLYYLGVMQAVILKIAWVMQHAMGTTAAESVNVAGNIFLGQNEAPLLIKPLLPSMTKSELHAVMTGGFATIAGSVLASYILFGVPAEHLIAASVMAAPCALGLSKLFCPESEESKTKAGSAKKLMDDSPGKNIIDAASSGASASIKLVANIAANLIAFIALLEFFNTTLQWMGDRVGLSPPDHPKLTFQLICSYVLWPFAFLMGVAVEDCRKVAELIGFKTFVNEFVAYTELGKLIENRKIYEAYNGTIERINDDIYLRDINTTLAGGILTPRSTVISTYALCGFANISSIGIVIGVMGSLLPEKKSIITTLAVRAMICGNVVSWLNACTAGLLYQGE